MDKKHFVITSRPVNKVAVEGQHGQFWYVSNNGSASEKAAACMYCGRYTEESTGNSTKASFPWFYDPGVESRDYSPAATWQDRFLARGGSNEMLTELFTELDHSGKDLLIFIHGFDNKIRKELVHLELLHHNFVEPPDSNIGRILMVSWPSMGVFQYNAQGAGGTIFEKLFKKKKSGLDIINDTSDFALTGDAFAIFLLKLKQFRAARYPGKAPGIHLIVQSMANQVLARALWRLDQAGKTGAANGLLESLILTSPDVPDDFLVAFPPYGKALALARQSWITCSEQDGTLRISSKTDGDPKHNRLGCKGPLGGMNNLPPNTGLLSVEQLLLRNKPIDYNHRYFQYSQEVVQFYRNVFAGKVQIPLNRIIQQPANNGQPGVDSWF